MRRRPALNPEHKTHRNPLIDEGQKIWDCWPLSKGWDTKSGFSADMPICIFKNRNLFETVASCCIEVTSVKSLATSCLLSSIAQSRFFVVGFMPAGQALSLLEPNEII